MDELVKSVYEKINVSPQQGKQAVETLLNFHKDRLPEPLAGQIDKVANGEEASGLGDITKGQGGMFGN